MRLVMLAVAVVLCAASASPRAQRSSSTAEAGDGWDQGLAERTLPAETSASLTRNAYRDVEAVELYWKNALVSRGSLASVMFVEAVRYKGEPIPAGARTVQVSVIAGSASPVLARHCGPGLLVDGKPVSVATTDYTISPNGSSYVEALTGKISPEDYASMANAHAVSIRACALELHFGPEQFARLRDAVELARAHD
jgi:hypothetical protein